MSSIGAPFLDLYLLVKQELPLVISDYHALVLALELSMADGSPILDWSSLGDICRALWVKDPEHQRQIFNRIFDRYQRLQHTAVDDVLRPSIAGAPPDFIGEWPAVPPRVKSGAISRQPPSPPPGKVPTAFKTVSPQHSPAAHSYTFRPLHLPVSSPAILHFWHKLSTPFQSYHHREIDDYKTASLIRRLGPFAEPVYRPLSGRKPSLLVLVDDNNGMIPYRPAILPFVRHIVSGQIQPAWLFRFTGYPSDYFYDWYHPREFVSISSVLKQLSRTSTVVLIISDAGAASHTRRSSLSDGILDFLATLSPRVRRVLWLNPLPCERWNHTSAALVKSNLQGSKQSFDRFSSGMQYLLGAD